MEDKFTWKGQIKFVGSSAQFNELSEMLDKYPVEFEIPEWDRIPDHLAGCFPFPLEILVSKDQIKKLTEGMPKIKIKYLRDIRGGIRTAHLHLDEQLVLLDRKRFKMMVGNVAEELAEMRVDRMSDYIDVMQVVGDIGRFSDPTPEPA